MPKSPAKVDLGGQKTGQYVVVDKGQLEALTQRAFPQDSSSKNHIHRPRGEANRKTTIRKSTGRARLGFNLQTASRLPLEQYKAYEDTVHRWTHKYCDISKTFRGNATAFSAVVAAVIKSHPWAEVYHQNWLTKEIMIQHLDHTAWKYSFKDFDPDWQDPETEYEYEVDTNNGENTEDADSDTAPSTRKRGRKRRQIGQSESRLSKKRKREESDEEEEEEEEGRQGKSEVQKKSQRPHKKAKTREVHNTVEEHHSKVSKPKMHKAHTTKKKKQQTAEQEEDEPLVTPKRPIYSPKASPIIRSPTPRSASPIVASPPAASIKDLTMLYALLADEADFYYKSWKELWKGQHLEEYELLGLLKKIDSRCASRRKRMVKDWSRAIAVAGTQQPLYGGGKRIDPKKWLDEQEERERLQNETKDTVKGQQQIESQRMEKKAISSPPKAVPADTSSLRELINKEEKFYKACWDELWSGYYLEREELEAILEDIDHNCKRQRQVKRDVWKRALAEAQISKHIPYGGKSRIDPEEWLEMQEQGHLKRADGMQSDEGMPAEDRMEIEEEASQYLQAPVTFINHPQPGSPNLDFHKVTDQQPPSIRYRSQQFKTAQVPQKRTPLTPIQPRSRQDQPPQHTAAVKPPTPTALSLSNQKLKMVQEGVPTDEDDQPQKPPLRRKASQPLQVKEEATYESESSDADSASAFESPLSPVSDDVEVPKVTSKGKRVIRATAGKAASRNTQGIKRGVSRKAGAKTVVLAPADAPAKNTRHHAKK